MTAVVRLAPMSGAVDLSPRSISTAAASLHRVVPASSVRKSGDRINQKIDEQAHTQRKLASKWVQDVNGFRDHRYLRQHDAQAASCKIILDRQAHEPRDASPLQGRLDQILSVIRIEGALRDDSCPIGK